MFTYGLYFLPREKFKLLAHDQSVLIRFKGLPVCCGPKFSIIAPIISVLLLILVRIGQW